MKWSVKVVKVIYDGDSGDGMPIYTYKCLTCQTVKDEIQKHSDPPPQCCSLPMVKQITSATPHFKGGGFYETDYKRRGK